MFSFLKRKRRRPVVYARAEHCISRKNIDPDALRVLYRLSSFGYTAYLVGGGVRDLLLGREPKDFDVGTSARPNEVRRVFRNCFLIGRRFRLAHIKFGDKVIETATFRQESQTVGEIIEHAAEGPHEDNTFGTPETDAYRRDFTVNGLFYDIKDFSVIDWVGGMEDLKKKIVRAIGDPAIRFQEDPVRMMRAVKFSSRLGFTIERKTWAAMRKYHVCILNASAPRVCEEVFRLFSFGSAEKAFRLMWECGMLRDLLPELADAIERTGGAKSRAWAYLKVLDEFDRRMAKSGCEVSNALRAAVLMTPLIRERGKSGSGRKALQPMMQRLKVPKMTYFSAALLIESARRLSESPAKGKSRFVHNRDFLDALDYNRIVTRAEGGSEAALNEWADLYEETQRQLEAARRAEERKEAKKARAEADAARGRGRAPGGPQDGAAPARPDEPESETNTESEKKGNGK